MCVLSYWGDIPNIYKVGYFDIVNSQTNEDYLKELN